MESKKQDCLGFLFMWRFKYKGTPIGVFFSFAPSPISMCFSSQYSGLLAVVSAATFSNVQSNI